MNPHTWLTCYAGCMPLCKIHPHGCMTSPCGKWLISAAKKQRPSNNGKSDASSNKWEIRPYIWGHVMIHVSWSTGHVVSVGSVTTPKTAWGKITTGTPAEEWPLGLQIAQGLVMIEIPRPHHLPKTKSAETLGKWWEKCMKDFEIHLPDHQLVEFHVFSEVSNCDHQALLPSLMASVSNRKFRNHVQASQGLSGYPMHSHSYSYSKVKVIPGNARQIQD